MFEHGDGIARQKLSKDTRTHTIKEKLSLRAPRTHTAGEEE